MSAEEKIIELKKAFEEYDKWQISMSELIERIRKIIS